MVLVFPSVRSKSVGIGYLQDTVLVATEVIYITIQGFLVNFTKIVVCST